MKSEISKYEQTLERCKATAEDKDTFMYNGELLSYPWAMQLNEEASTYYSKLYYREQITWKLNRLKKEEELLNLPFKEQMRRYSKNTGLELLATTLESALAFLRIGGVSVHFDGLRNKKEETYCSYAKSQNNIADKFGYDNFGFY
jgi:hypothetical protein